MTRRLSQLLMFLVLIVSVASLIHTTLSRSEPCPLCGGRMQQVRAVRALSFDKSRWTNAHVVYRCSACDYDVFGPARYDVISTTPAK